MALSYDQVPDPCSTRRYEGIAQSYDRLGATDKILGHGNSRNAYTTCACSLSLSLSLSVQCARHRSTRPSLSNYIYVRDLYRTKTIRNKRTVTVRPENRLTPTGEGGNKLKLTVRSELTRPFASTRVGSSAFNRKLFFSDTRSETRRETLTFETRPTLVERVSYTRVFRRPRLRPFF